MDDVFCDVCQKPTQKNVMLFGKMRKIRLFCRCEEERRREEEVILQREQTMARLAPLLKGRFSEMTLKSYRGPERSTAIEYCRTWRTAPPDRRSLFITGPCGTGKTHLAIAVMKNLVAMYGVRGVFVAWIDHINMCMDAHRANRNFPTLSGQVILLDDIDKANSRFALELLFSVVDRAYRTNAGLITTANYLHEGSDHEKAIARRIKSGVTITTYKFGG